MPKNRETQRVGRGESADILIDWEPGLREFDAIVDCSCQCAVKPAGAEDLAVAMDGLSAPTKVNQRRTNWGDVTKLTVDVSGDQIRGVYEIAVTAKTLTGMIIPRRIRLEVV